MKKFLKYTGLLCIMIGIGLSCYIGYWYYEMSQSIKENDKVKSEVVVDESKKTEDNKKDINPLTRKIDFDKLMSINSDAKYWIYLPGTNLDRVVMDEKAHGKYFYLNHSINKRYRAEGELFTPKRYNDDNFIVFGLLMDYKYYGDYMLTNLRKWYKDKDSAIDYKYIYLYEKGKIYKYQFAVSRAGLTSDLIYKENDGVVSFTYEKLIDDLNKNHDLKVFDLKETDHILTLSTCDGSYGDAKRYYAVFKLDMVYNI